MNAVRQVSMGSSGGLCHARGIRPACIRPRNPRVRVLARALGTRHARAAAGSS